MAYPQERVDAPQSIAFLIEKEEGDQFISKDELSALFTNGETTLERLRLHYLEVGETTDEDEEEAEPEPDEEAAEDAAESLLDVETDLEALDDLPALRGERIDAVGQYLKEMSQVPLLTNEEEVSIAKRIEAAKKAKRKLKNLNGHSTPKQKIELKNRVTDGQAARNHLIQANTRLVVSIAKRYVGRGVPFLDLIQEGNLGLMKAVNKYDYRRGFRFSTYATWWIRQTITRSIADQGRTIRVPVHMVDRIRQLYKSAHKLEQELGRPPNVEELSVELELSSKKVQWMLRVSWLPLSLESPVGDEEDSELGMFVEDDTSPSPSQATYEHLVAEKIGQVLDSLSAREARILRLRFGLEDGRTYTLEEVGEKFGLTRERIRQIEGKALRRLRHPVRSRQLRDLL
jgi:RNA polymerase primary sigma factor